MLAGAGAQAQELQFNVPYQCAGGLTMVIDRCETGDRGEFCFFDNTVNGVGRSESYGRRNRCRRRSGRASLRRQERRGS